MNKVSVLAAYPGSVRVSRRPSAYKMHIVQIHSRGSWKAVKSFVSEVEARQLAEKLSNADHNSIGSIHTQQYRAADRAVRIYK